MTTVPDAQDLRPEMGTTRNNLEKVAIIVTWILCGIILSAFYRVTGLFPNRPSFLWWVFTLGLHIGLTYLVWRFLRRYRILKFRHERGDYESAMEAKQVAASQAKEKAAELAATTAEKSGMLASGAAGFIKDAGVAAAKKLEQRATHGKDSSNETKDSNQDDIAGRLEKLSNLHEQGHISDEEFAQQRSRILDEV
ncbi:MAG: SHOCT domain-containing protein [Candidatus Magasanikbacteria bacterium]|jgi:hypothetical protein|nr:SHOCT domain-containing protein [Candidatus Magasanikbacteria bacterium]